jgi:hypothetical protein
VGGVCGSVGPFTQFSWVETVSLDTTEGKKKRAMEESTPIESQINEQFEPIGDQAFQEDQ